MQEIQVQSLIPGDPLEKDMSPSLVFLPEKSHGQSSLVRENSKRIRGCDIEILKQNKAKKVKNIAHGLEVYMEGQRSTKGILWEEMGKV